MLAGHNRRVTEAYPTDGADPFLQEALRSFMEGVCVGGLSQKNVEAPEVGLPVEDVVLVIDSFIVDVQLIEVLCILEVILVARSLQKGTLLGLDIGSFPYLLQTTLSECIFCPADRRRPMSSMLYLVHPSRCPGGRVISALGEEDGNGTSVSVDARAVGRGGCCVQVLEAGTSCGSQRRAVPAERFTAHQLVL